MNTQQGLILELPKFLFRRMELKSGALIHSLQATTNALNTYTKRQTEVAMEATGVYWMALYAMFESCGIKANLINPKETKQVKGRKTDVKDCRWIQKLFSAGILRSSFIPEGKYMEIRHLVESGLIL